MVGESGCGKSTLGRCIVGDERATAGHVYYQESPGHVADLVTAGKEDLRRYQRDIRVIFQDPFSSLNPRMTVAQIVGDPLASRHLARGSELEDRVAEALRRVGLSPTYMRRFPHAFSGGERQRINIARALILNPRFVIADEAVSALDVSVRAQIINLLRDLQEELSLTYLFISHDLSVVESICDRVAVMYLGKIVELADTEEIYAEPKHPYTEALLSAVPRPDPRLRGAGGRIRLSDEFPDPSDPPAGCFFHTRCPYADPERCSADPTVLRELTPKHWSDCHYSETLTLAGVGAEQEVAAS
ncbi:ABC transporter ATP-binding protein [Microlunatus endophyticus]